MFFPVFGIGAGFFCGFGFADWAGAAHVFEEALQEGFAGIFGDDFGDRCEGAVDGVELHLFDLVDLLGLGCARVAREVDRGYADCVEEKTAALEVDLIQRDATGYCGDGELDRWAVFEAGQVEG